MRLIAAGHAQASGILFDDLDQAVRDSWADRRRIVRVELFDFELVACSFDVVKADDRRVEHPVEAVLGVGDDQALTCCVQIAFDGISANEQHLGAPCFHRARRE